MRQIANNAGFEGSVVVQKVAEGKGNFGFNAETGKYEDLLEAGIIDPTKVARFALQNAASVAGLLLTTKPWLLRSLKRRRPLLCLRCLLRTCTKINDASGRIFHPARAL